MGDVLLGRVADAVVVNGFEAEGADEVVGQGLMRGEAGDQFEGDGLTIAGRGGLRVVLAVVWVDLLVMISILFLCPGGPAGVVPASAPSGAVSLGRA